MGRKCFEGGNFHEDPTGRMKKINGACIYISCLVDLYNCVRYRTVAAASVEERGAVLYDDEMFHPRLACILVLPA